MREGTFKTEGGDTLRIVAVSQVDLSPIYRKIDENRPKPPVEVIGGGPNGPVEVENEAHPDYLAAIKEFNLKLTNTFIAANIEYGVDLELNQEQLKRVTQIMRRREEQTPGLIENSFKIFTYISLICPTLQELRKLSADIEGLNKPTARMVQDEVNTFRPDVEGRADNEGENARELPGVAVG